MYSTAFLRCRRNAFLHTGRTYQGREGGWYNPLDVSPLIELGLRGKKRKCRPLRDSAIGTQI